MLQSCKVDLVYSQTQKQNIGIHIELVFFIVWGFGKELENTTKDEKGEVILSIGDGLMVVGDGCGRLHERLIDCRSFAVSDVLSGLLFETKTQLGYYVFLLHASMMLIQQFDSIYYICCL